jgi:hypothetical protein
MHQLYMTAAGNSHHTIGECKAWESHHTVWKKPKAKS